MRFTALKSVDFFTARKNNKLLGNFFMGLGNLGENFQEGWKQHRTTKRVNLKNKIQSKKGNPTGTEMAGFGSQNEAARSEDDFETSL